MRKFIYFVFTIFILFLSGCDNKPNGYKFSYDLTMDNYTDFIYISTSIQKSYDTGSNYFQIEVKIIDDDVLLDDVEIVYNLNEYTDFSGDYMSSNHRQTYTSNSNLITELPLFINVHKVTVKVTDIKGRVLTKTSREINYEHSEEAKSQLKSELRPFLEANELYIETKISQKIGTQTTTEYVDMNIRKSPFYFSSFSTYQGVIITESNNSYLLTEVGRYDDIYYYRHIDQFDNLDESDSLSQVNFGVDLSDDFAYSLENDIYILVGDTKTILSRLITDQETLNAFLDVYKQSHLILKIEIKDQSYTETVTLKVNNRSVTVTMTYDISKFRETNLDNYVQMPALKPELITHSTDVSETVKDQLLVSGTRNYYSVELTGGLYAFEIDSLYDLNFYTLDGESVEFDKATDPLYSVHRNIYYIPEGTYTLSVSSSIRFTRLYDFRIFPLSSYKTTGDPLTPIMLTEDTINVEIEGLYDYVFIAVDAPEGGLLTLTPNKASNHYIYRYPGGYNQNRSIFNNIQGKPLYISLDPGMNIFKIDSRYVETVLFEIDLHGVTWHDDMELTDSYSDEFIVASGTESSNFSFTMDDDCYFVIDILLDDMLVFNSSGYGAYIYKANDLGVFHPYLSLSIKESQTKVYLPKGEYTLKISTILSYKIKSSREVPTNLTSDVLTPYHTNYISSTLKNRDLNSYDTYNWYPQNIKKLHFTLSESDYVYIDLNNPKEFVLLDSLDNVVNLYDPSSLLIYLEADTYTLFFKENDTSKTIKITVQIYIVDDTLVKADDSYYQSPKAVEWGIGFKFKFNYVGDSDYALFTLENDAQVSIFTNQSVQITIFDEQGKLIRSFRGTSLTLDLKPGKYYLTVNFGILYTPDIGTYYNFRLQKKVT